MVHDMIHGMNKTGLLVSKESSSQVEVNFDSRDRVITDAQTVSNILFI